MYTANSTFRRYKINELKVIIILEVEVKIAVEVVALGYAGNPKGYEAVSKIAKQLIEVQVDAICENI